MQDARISYDSRLWDDVRGCGGFITVTGIEDVERMIFHKYNTILHEMTHQVHYVLTQTELKIFITALRKKRKPDRKPLLVVTNQQVSGNILQKV
jgi:hypothetical protein